MAPVEFRGTNLAREGRPHATSQVLKDHPIEKVMDKVLERMEWSKPFDSGGNSHIKRGRGFAIANKAVISPTTSVAIVNVSADGSATLYCGTVDMGQGSDTAMAQMVGEVLNIPAESVRVTPRDTDVTPYDMGTLGSRSLFHMGHEVRRAAEDARDKLKALAKEVGEPEGSNIPIADLFQKRYGMQACNVIGSGIFKPDYISPAPGTGQRSQASTICLRNWKATTSSTINRTARSAPRAWAKCRPSASVPRSPMRSTTRSACASWRCRLKRRPSIARSAPRWASRWRMSDMA